jgi:hypothetical protein
MRLQRLEPAHEYVEQAVARRLLGVFAATARKHFTVGLANEGGDHVECRPELAPHVGQRNAGLFGDGGESDVLERLLGEQREEGLDDLVAIGVLGPGKPPDWILLLI